VGSVHTVWDLFSWFFLLVYIRDISILIFLNKYIIPPRKSLSKYSNGNGKSTAEPGKNISKPSS
jgi:hypothetical protein